MLIVVFPQSHRRAASSSSWSSLCMMIQLALPSVGLASQTTESVGGTCFVSSPHSFAQPLSEGCCPRRGLRHVSSGDTWVLLWHELSPGSPQVLILLEGACVPLRLAQAVCLTESSRGQGSFPAFRPTSARCHWRRAPCILAVEVSWFMTSISSRLFRVACARLRLLTPAAVAAVADHLVVRGYHSTNSALC